MFDAFHHILLSMEINSQYGLIFAWFAQVLVIGLLSWTSNYIAKRYIVDFIRKHLTRAQGNHFKVLAKHQIFTRLSHLAPAIVVYLTLPLLAVDELSITLSLVNVLKIAIQIYFVVIIFSVASALLHYIDDVYNHLAIARRRPIKSYLQVVKIILFIIMMIITISIALNKSPVAFLTGLGAMTAILTLVFKDSILGFVASVQLTSYDMVRIGDWIEMPEFGADGDVVDMSLNTIKVQNFDHTIVTIPSYSLLTKGVKNWRGMSESGGRRIKRAVYLDMQSIRFCTEDDLARFSKIRMLVDLMQNKIDDIKAYNVATHNDNRDLRMNGRNLTNIGLFRLYLEQYLRQHPQIQKNMTFMVRQLAPASNGLPIEIYVFTNTTDWLKYEAIQADIFDHVLASVNYFDLRLFQNISDSSASLLSAQPPALI